MNTMSAKSSDMNSEKIITQLRCVSQTAHQNLVLKRRTEGSRFSTLCAFLNECSHKHLKSDGSQHTSRDNFDRLLDLTTNSRHSFECGTSKLGYFEVTVEHVCVHAWRERRCQERINS